MCTLRTDPINRNSPIPRQTACDLIKILPSTITLQSTRTAVEMKYPMWLVPVSAFLKLSKLEPHQVMRERGELVMWKPSMKNVFFLSHRK